MTAVAPVAATVDRLLADRRPFAVFRLPGEDVRIAGCGGDVRVALCPWNTPRERAVEVTGDSPIEATPMRVKRPLPRNFCFSAALSMLPEP